MSTHSTLTDEVRRCFDAYGADIAKWPNDKRARYSALARSDDMAPLREEAEALDGFLGAASAPRMRADLKNRIAAQYEPSKLRLNLSALLRDLLSQSRLVPAGALAGVGALGLATGLLTANVQIAKAPEYEAYAYLEYAGVGINEEEAVQWEGD